MAMWQSWARRRAAAGRKNGRPGAAYVFERQSNGVWQQVAKLLPLYEEPEGPGSSNFGTSVAIEGNVIVVGCYFSPQTTVFERRDGVWTRAAVLDDTGGGTVDIQDGTIITSFIGGAHLYRRGATGWTKVQELKRGRRDSSECIGDEIGPARHEQVKAPPISAAPGISRSSTGASDLPSLSAVGMTANTANSHRTVQVHRYEASWHILCSQSYRSCALIFSKPFRT